MFQNQLMKIVFLHLQRLILLVSFLMLIQIVLTQIKITSLPLNGTLYYNGTPIEADQIIAVNQLDKITFQPDTNWYGEDTFTWNGYDGTDWSLSDKSVNVTVNPVNDAPVNTTIPDFTGTLHAGSSVTKDDGVWNDFTDTSVAGGTSNITYSYQWQLATDENGAGVADISGETNSTLNIISNYAHKYIRLKVTASNDGIGSTTTQTVAYSLWKYVSNNSPVVSDISKIVNEDTLLSFTISDFTGHYTDADTDSLTQIKITSLPNNGTVFFDGVAATLNQIIASDQLDKITFLPATNWNGNTSFKWNGFDGSAWADTAKDVLITVDPVNDIPVANTSSTSTAEDTIKTGNLSGSDVEGSSLQYSLVGAATHGTAVVNSDGSYTYTPSSNYYGTDSFTFRVYDGTDYSLAVGVTITVNPVNDAPVNTTIPDITGTMQVGNAITRDDGVWNDLIDTSVAGGTSNITYTYQWQVATDGSGTGAANISSATGTTLNLTNTFAHKYIRLKVTGTNDGIGMESTQTAAYSTWKLVLDSAPTVSDIAKTINENSTLKFAKSDFVNHFSDVDADSLNQIKVASLPANGTLYLDGSPVSINQTVVTDDLGKLSFSPDADWYGSTSFKWNGV